MVSTHRLLCLIAAVTMFQLVDRHVHAVKTNASSPSNSTKKPTPRTAQLTPATLSNLLLPHDIDGIPLLTGETNVVFHDGRYWFFVNDWGGCSFTDCCDSVQGCASCCYVPPSKQYPDTCVFATNHSVVLYSTSDLTNWTRHGVVLSPLDYPRGIEFRPHVVYNPTTKTFIMWFEDRPSAIVSAGYSVAVSTSITGPFEVIESGIKMADIPGDFDLLVDDDGSCYHVQTTTNDPNATTGFVVTMLNTSYTAPASPTISKRFESPLPAEGPAFFKRGPKDYFILAGTTCCACKGGSSVYMFRSPSPLGPWRFVRDVGSVTPRHFDPHSASNYVTRSQASSVFHVAGNHQQQQWVWLGNQWGLPGITRNSDLLYWHVLEFSQTNGDVLQFVWAPNATVSVDPLL
eukprot:m.218170 g.218170  ORF g.218170 m.218170 type:complete len:402 (-) comp33256_c1_seq4:91-1296(-)